MKSIDNSKLLSPARLIAIAALAVIGTIVVVRSFAASTSLSLVASNASVNVGDNVNVAIRVNSGSDEINVVQANIKYDPTKMQYLSNDTSNSAFPLDASTQIDSSTGAIKIARARSGGTAPVSGDNLIVNLSFKALKVTTANVTFDTGSMVVRSTDNTDILSLTNPVAINLVDITAPAVPTGLTASGITLMGANIAWSASSDNVGATGYRVYRNGTQVATPTSLSFVDSGLTPGTTYSYKIAAVDAAGNVSAQSAALSVTTLADTSAPTVPSAPTSASQTMTSVSLAWAASTDNVGVKNYRVYRNGTLISSPTGTSLSDSGLAPGTTYAYTVAAVDAAGNVSAQSSPLSVKTLADTAAPTTPGNFSGTSSGANISLTWTASTDNVGVTGYAVYRNGTQIATVTTTSYTVSNSNPGSYQFTVAALDAAGNKSAQTTAAVLVVYNNADVNQDNKVNGLDLSSVLTGWGKTGSQSADINKDGVVNGLDLSIILSKWTN